MYIVYGGIQASMNTIIITIKITITLMIKKVAG